MKLPDIRRHGLNLDFADSRIVIPYDTDLSEPWLYSRAMWCGSRLDGMSPFWLNFLLSEDFVPSFIAERVASSSMYFSIDDRLYVMNVECPQADLIIDEADPNEPSISATNLGKTMVVTRRNDSAFHKYRVNQQPISHFVEDINIDHLKEIRGRVERLSFVSSGYLVITFSMSAVDENDKVIATHFPVLGAINGKSRDSFWLDGNVTDSGHLSVETLTYWQRTGSDIELVIPKEHLSRTRTVCINSVVNANVGQKVVEYAGLECNNLDSVGYLAPTDLLNT